MTANAIFQDSRVLHVRALKAENDRLQAELRDCRAARAVLESHFALALAALQDAAALPPDGRILVLDGWNIVLGARAEKSAPPPPSRDALLAQARAYAQAHADTFVWLVFDGADEHVAAEGRLRVSYTGGAGAHRADRLILDYLRALRVLGKETPVTLVTADRDFAAAARRLGALCKTPSLFPNAI